jgi:hypothetical protein
LPETWNDLVEHNGEENDITADDITDPGSQAVFAAIVSIDAQTKLTASLGRTPTIAQLYFTHLFGIEAAASILARNQQTRIEQALRDFYKPEGGELADKIIKSNLALVTDKTVGQVLDAVVDPLAAGLTRAADLATELGLELQVPVSPAFGNNLQTALRAAVRHHEIGDDPDAAYKLSFAEKGRSGASFGFMQGDLGQNQQEVKDAFHRALKADNVLDTDISRIMESLSGQVTSTSLSNEDKIRVNKALNTQEGRKLVNAMDEKIFADVCMKLDRCLDAATSSDRTITPEAQIYMLLWINMTGPPTDLLDWLSGKSVRGVAAPGATADRSAIEEYLKASKYFTQNPGNFQHMVESVATGAKLLTDAPSASLSASTPSAGVARLSAARSDIDLTETPSIRDLVAIVGEASTTLPDGYRVIVTSAKRPGATVGGGGGRSQHADGNAIDIQIINPRGVPIRNRGEDDTGYYKRLATAAYRANERRFPDRSGRLAWGGNFGVAANSNERDLMHFDYGGDRGRLGPPPRGDLGPLAQLATATTTTV